MAIVEESFCYRIANTSVAPGDKNSSSGRHSSQAYWQVTALRYGHHESALFGDEPSRFTHIRASRPNGEIFGRDGYQACLYRRVFSRGRLVVACPRCRRRFSALLCRCCGKQRGEEVWFKDPIAARNLERHKSSVIIPGSSSATHRCSRAGCTEMPSWAIHWRNPKIHAPDRTKIWLSCVGHREYFEAYLGQKGFPVASHPHPQGGA